MLRKVEELLGHLIFILSLMFMVFLVLDQFNPMMNFVDHPISQWLLGILCACGLTRSILGFRPTEK